MNDGPAGRMVPVLWMPLMAQGCILINLLFSCTPLVLPHPFHLWFALARVTWTTYYPWTLFSVLILARSLPFHLSPVQYDAIFLSPVSCQPQELPIPCTCLTSGFQEPYFQRFYYVKGGRQDWISPRSPRIEIPPPVLSFTAVGLSPHRIPCHSRPW